MKAYKEVLISNDIKEKNKFTDGGRFNENGISGITPEKAFEGEAKLLAKRAKKGKKEIDQALKKTIKNE